jgi:RimJ/RimL family protein N-acetyltransferase
MTGNWSVGLISDKERLLAFLESDRLYAAYAIGDLEPELYAQCTWSGAEQAGQVRALGLVFRGFEPPAFFLMGEPEGLEAVLKQRLLPARAYLTCRAGHLPYVAKYYSWIQGPVAMWRMVLNRKRPPFSMGTCIRMTPRHAGQIQYLVDQAGISGFAAAQIDRGVFFGIFKDERLVSMAGTHLISPRYGIAAVGNVVTHPEARGQGLGTVVVGAVLSELTRTGIRDIVLNARQENAPALHLYEKLGFERYGAFFEGPASIREAGSAQERNDAKR